MIKIKNNHRQALNNRIICMYGKPKITYHKNFLEMVLSGLKKHPISMKVS